MSETSQIVWDMAARLFTEQFTPQALHRAEAGDRLDAQWDKIEELGLPLALVPEEDGGVGLDAVEASMLVRIAGSFAVPLPLAETMLANRLLATAGLPLAAGPATVAPVRLDDRLALAEEKGGWRLSGTVHWVPWGRSAAVLVGIVEHGGRILAVRLTADQVQGTSGVNLASEPRDSLVFDTSVSESAVAPLPEGWGVADAFAIGAALRTAAIAGAVGRVLEMTVGYANDRVQFGRPIGKFQAIQQNLAIMAGHAAAAAGSADLAAEAVRDGGAITPGSLLAIAAGKARAGEAAGIVATIAHQVHGAIGFTHEHSLHFLTKRLWSWRDEFGNEAHWNRQIGQRMIAAGADGVWPLIASV